jgi:hypothetical protein
VDPRTGVDDVKKIKYFTLAGLEHRPLRRPARSESLSWLLFLGRIFQMLDESRYMLYC